MKSKIMVTFWPVLAKKAKAVSKARLSGDHFKLRLAELQHKEYQEYCNKADKVVEMYR